MATRPDGAPPAVHAAKYALRSLARRIAELTNEINEINETERTIRRSRRTQRTPHPGTARTRPDSHRADARHRRTEHRPTAWRNCIRAPLRHRPDPRLIRQNHPAPPHPYGNRDANRTLHMIAVVRLRYCQRTRVYLARRTAVGLSKKDIMRCLKRYIAREIYYALRADLNELALTT